MKIDYKIFLIVVLIGVVLVSGCVKEEIPPEKYCENDDDCLTSCNSPSGFAGLGSDCYNADYVKNKWKNKEGYINSPIDDVCCGCDDATNPFRCVCKKNMCITKKI